VSKLTDELWSKYAGTGIIVLQHEFKEAVEEALELAARECDAGAKAGLPAMWISANAQSAAAIRKLKVE